IDTAVVQDADTPLGFYFLATLVLLVLHDRRVSEGRPSRGLLLLAGLAAGLAAWTKNEGMLFLIAVVAVRFVVEARARGWRLPVREAVIFGLGALPILLVLVYFKTQPAPANDLVVGQGLRETSARLLDLRRYGMIFATVRETVLNSGP